MPLLSLLALLGAAPPAAPPPQPAPPEAPPSTDNPTFSGAEGDVRLAKLAWEAAAACTGRKGKASPEVKISRAFPESRPVIAVRLDGDVLMGVFVHKDDVPFALAMGVARAWVGEAPAPLLHVRAQLLAECVAAKHPADFGVLHDLPTELAEMPDLRTWGQAGQELPDGPPKRDAYAGALRLGHALGQVLPAAGAWTGAWPSWDALLTALDGAGDKGKPLAAALRGGAEAQRAALADRDGDGLVGVEEQWAGTDAARWDSDGDGWWDGASKERPADAVPLPGDRSPVCFKAAPGAGARFDVGAGGALRGIAVPNPYARGVNADALVGLTALHATFNGGVWVQPTGTAAPNPGCSMTPRATVRVQGELGAAQLDALHAALDRARAKYEAAVGPSAQRYTVEINAGEMLLRGAARDGYVSVVVPFDLTKSALKPGKEDALAEQIAALHFTWTAPNPLTRTADAGAALYVAVSKPAKGTGLLQADPTRFEAWNKAVAACGTGWKGLFDGSCTAPGW